MNRNVIGVNMTNRGQNIISDSDNRTRSDLNQKTSDMTALKNHFHELINMAGQPETEASVSDVPDAISGQFCKNPSDIELQQWNQMWTRLISMITRYIPFPSVQSSTGSEKRAVLVDLVSKLCDRVQKPKDSQEYEILQKKYSKAKKSLHHLRGQCETLLNAVRQNARDLENHIKHIDVHEKESIAKKLDELSHILARQLKQEDLLLNDTKYRKNLIKKTMQKYPKYRRYQSSDSDFDDERYYKKRVMTVDNISSSSSSDDIYVRKPKKTSIHREPPHSGDGFKYSRKCKRPHRSQLFNESSDDDVVVHKTSVSKSKYSIKPRKDSKSRKRKFSSSSEEIDLPEPVSRPRSSSQNKKYLRQYKRCDFSSSSEGSSSDMVYSPKSITKKSRVIFSSDDEKRAESGKSQRIKYPKYTKSTRKFMEDDADEIREELSKMSSPKYRRRSSANSFRRTYGNHVNQLVDVANGLRDDYKHLRRVFKDGSDSDYETPSTLSYIRDSVVKPRKRYVDCSD